MNNVVTIPKTLAQQGDLVIIPRSEYEEYLNFKRVIPIVKASQAEKKGIKLGRQEMKKGAYFSLRDLKDAVGS